MAAKRPRPVRASINAVGEPAKPAAMEHAPMPMKKTTIMAVAPTRSLSMPAGSAAAPTMREPRVHNSMSW